jgi:hypothetical protein
MKHIEDERLGPLRQTIGGRNVVSRDRADREEEIRLRAYQIYLQRGGQDGSELQDWLQAEAEVLEVPRRQQAA